MIETAGSEHVEALMRHLGETVVLVEVVVVVVTVVVLVVVVEVVIVVDVVVTHFPSEHTPGQLTISSLLPPLQISSNNGGLFSSRQ